MARNRTLTIDASAYASETANSGYTVTCGDATNLHSRLQRVARTDCSFVITPLAAAIPGTATFTIPYTSSGGDTTNGVVSVAIGTDSTLSITPAGRAAGQAFVEVRNRRVTYIDASRWATDSGYSVTCSGARFTVEDIAGSAQPRAATNRELLSFSRSANCLYRIQPDIASGTYLKLSVSLRSSGGDTGTLAVNIYRQDDLRTSISASAPAALKIYRGQKISLDAASYASSTQPFFCLEPANIGSRITVERTRDCAFEIAGGQTLGTAGFDITYASAAGGTLAGQSLTSTITVPVEVVRASLCVLHSPSQRSSRDCGPEHPHLTLPATPPSAAPSPMNAKTPRM